MNIKKGLAGLTSAALVLLSVQATAYANPFRDIINTINGVNNTIRSLDNTINPGFLTSMF